MRASRLLRILIILQNRGRQSSAQLANELEVTRRTIMRDVDAMGEAGLPIIVHRGAQGGIELGFNYRTRLTGLSKDEAQAIGILLGQSQAFLQGFGLREAGQRATDKLLEGFPDKIRHVATTSAAQFHYANASPDTIDPRVPVVANAIRNQQRVTLQARRVRPIFVTPGRLMFDRDTWILQGTHNDQSDNKNGDQAKEWPLSDWGDINISRNILTRIL